ncbi:MAG: BamA/TamA family outer membrane protein [Calditrichia bacterium]
MILFIFTAFAPGVTNSNYYYFTSDTTNKDTIFFQPVKINNLGVGLALSGGGARGIAHIGVLKGIEEYGLPISQISGSSIGAIVGAYYSAGYRPDEILSVFHQFDFGDMFVDRADRTNIIVPQKKENDRYFLGLRFNKDGPYIPNSLSSGQKLMELFNSTLLPFMYDSGNDYKQLSIPLKIIATDLLNGEKVVFQSGPLGQNLLAGMAYPLLFTPVKVKNRWLIDGGIVDNLPGDELDSNLDLKLGVDVTAGLRKVDQFSAPWQIADQVTTIMMKYNEKNKKYLDVVISPSVKQFSSTDFNKIDLFFEKGQSIFQIGIPQIEDIFKSRVSPDFRFIHLNISTANFIFGNKDTIRLNIDSTIVLNKLVSGLDKIIDTTSPIKYSPQTRAMYIEMLKKPDFKYIITYLDSVQIAERKVKWRDYFLSTYFTDSPTVLRYYKVEMGKKGIIVDTCLTKLSGDTLRIMFYSPRIDSVAISSPGKLNIKEYILLRELEPFINETISSETILQIQKNIYALDLFTHANVYLQKKSGKNILYIGVVEKPNLFMKVGIHSNKNYKGEFSFLISHNNVLSHNLVFTMDGLIGTIRRYFRGEFNSNRVWYSEYGLGAGYENSWESKQVFFNDSLVGHFSHRLNEFSAHLETYLAKIGYTRLGLFWRNLRSAESLSNLNSKNDYNSFGFRLESIFDSRNEFPMPSAGTYIRWKMESFTMKNKSKEWNINKAELHFEAYKKLFKFSTVNPYFYGGILENQSPFAEWFSTSPGVRKTGWNIYEKFGKVYSVFGIQWIQKIFPFVWGEKYLLLRGDMGNFWINSEEHVNWHDFEKGFGVGILVSSVIGPIQISYEFSETKKPFFWFSLGYYY